MSLYLRPLLFLIRSLKREGLLPLEKTWKHVFFSTSLLRDLIRNRRGRRKRLITSVRRLLAQLSLMVLWGSYMAFPGPDTRSIIQLFVVFKRLVLLNRYLKRKISAINQITSLREISALEPTFSLISSLCYRASKQDPWGSIGHIPSYQTSS